MWRFSISALFFYGIRECPRSKVHKMIPVLLMLPAVKLSLFAFKLPNPLKQFGLPQLSTNRGLLCRQDFALKIEDFALNERRIAHIF